MKKKYRSLFLPIVLILFSILFAVCFFIVENTIDKAVMIVGCLFILAVAIFIRLAYVEITDEYIIQGIGIRRGLITQQLLIADIEEITMSKNNNDILINFKTTSDAAKRCKHKWAFGAVIKLKALDIPKRSRYKIAVLVKRIAEQIKSGEKTTDTPQAQIHCATEEIKRIRDKKYFPRQHIITAVIFWILSISCVAGAIFIHDLKIQVGLACLTVLLVCGGAWLAAMNIKVTDSEIRIKFTLRSNTPAYINNGFKTTVITIDDLEEIICQSNNNYKVTFLFKNGDAILLDGGKTVNKEFAVLFADVIRQVAYASSKTEN